MSQNLRQASHSALVYVHGIPASYGNGRHPFPRPHGSLAEAVIEKPLETEVGAQLGGADSSHGRGTWLWRFGDDICEPTQLVIGLAIEGPFGTTSILSGLGTLLNDSGAFFGYFLCTSKESDSRNARNALRALARKLLPLISSSHPFHNNTQVRQEGSA